MCLVLPVTRKWVKEMNVDIKVMLMELLPWNVFLYVFYILLLSISVEKSPYTFYVYKDGMLIIGTVFNSFFLLWLVCVVMYVTYDFAIPMKHDTLPEGPKEMTGTVRFDPVYPSKSQLVMGLSLKYSRIISLGNKVCERETKAIIKCNTLQHNHYRIKLSELN